MLQSLLLVVVGGLIGAGGTMAGQYLLTRNARQTHAEEVAREDRYRLYRDRLEAYHQFHIAAGHARRAMSKYSRVRNDPLAHQRLVEARQQFWQAFTLVWLIGELDVCDAADDLFNIVEGVTWGDASFEPDTWSDRIRAFVEVARHRLLLETKLDKRKASPEDRLSVSSE